MTIAATVTAQQYSCNGSTTQFSFPNKVFAATDLVVTLIDLLGNLYSFVGFANVGLGLNYTVQNVDVDTGCLVAFNLGPANGWTLDIRTVTPNIQSTSIKNQGAFLPELHEEAFDKITREAQDLRRLTYTFGIHGPDLETTPWPALPAAASRKLGVLYFDSNGLPNVGLVAGLSQVIALQQLDNYGTDSGSANAYVVTVVGTTPFALTLGTLVRFTPANANTGPSTANIGGTGPQTVVNPTGGALSGGEFGTNVPTWLFWNGSAWQIAFSGITAAIDQTYNRSAQEILAGVVPVNYGYVPGDVWRYCTAAQIANIVNPSQPYQDLSGPINNAVLGTTGVVYFRSGTYFVNAPIYIPNTVAVVNIQFVGESRTSTYIAPMSVNIQDGITATNAVFINRQVNGKASWRNLRFWTNVAFTGHFINANRATPGGQVLFSGSIQDCWGDASTAGNTHFFDGGLSNFRISRCDFESFKGMFNFTDATADVHFESITYSNAYDYFIQSSLAGNNIISMRGFHAYTHNRGVLFPISNANDLTFVGVTLQAADTTSPVGNSGSVGLFNFNNCTDVKVSDFGCSGNAAYTSTATAGTGTATLNDTGQAWVTNQLVGFTLYNLTLGLSAVITANTATSVTTAGIAGQASGNVYNIIWPTGTQLFTLGPLSTQIQLQATQAVFSNGVLCGCDSGILFSGAGALDVSFNNVKIFNTNTAALRVAAGNPSGVVRMVGCDFSNSMGTILLWANVAAFDFYADDSRFMNAGLMLSGGRVHATGSSGLTRFSDCVIGQNNALAVAQYYIDNAGGGPIVYVNPAFLGAPPTGIQNPVATTLSSIGKAIVTYSASMTFSAQYFDEFEITATNGVAFTINSPTLPMDGKRVRVTLINTSGGALGAVTWGGAFKLPAGITYPANANNRTYEFYYTGTIWRSVNYSSTDVAN